MDLLVTGSEGLVGKAVCGALLGVRHRRKSSLSGAGRLLLMGAPAVRVVCMCCGPELAAG